MRITLKEARELEIVNRICEFAGINPFIVNGKWINENESIEVNVLSLDKEV